jgi:hypothetical protein
MSATGEYLLELLLKAALDAPFLLLVFYLGMRAGRSKSTR